MRLAMASFISVAILIRSDASYAQVLLKPTPVPVKIHRLTLVSNDLTPHDRSRISAVFQGKCYFRDESEERIRQLLREEGYYRADVKAPKVTHISGSLEKRSAD